MKSRFALGIARFLAHRRLSRAMDGVWVQGLEAARAVSQEGPVLFCATHVSWWDGLLLLPLDAALGTDGYVLMDVAQLAKLPFFRPLGAIGIGREPAALLHALREAETVLERPGQALWIFPQGRQRPAHLRPLSLQRGFETVARRTGAKLIPVALTYAFREAPQPAALVSFGAPVAPADLEPALIAGLDRIDRFVEGAHPASAAPFVPLIPGRGVREDRTLRSRLLAWLARPLLGGPRG